MLTLWTAMLRTVMQRAALRGGCKYQVLASNSLNTDILSNDPSVPPANGVSTLNTLPVELLRFITADLDPIAHHSLRLSRKSLRAHVDAPPLMSYGEYIQFHKQFEAHSPANSKSFSVPFATPSRNPRHQKQHSQMPKPFRTIAANVPASNAVLRMGTTTSAMW